MKLKALLLSALALSSMSASAYYNVQKKTWYSSAMGNYLKIESYFGCVNPYTMYESHRIKSISAGLYPGQPYQGNHYSWQFKVYSNNSDAYAPGNEFMVDTDYFTDSNNNYLNRTLPIINHRPYGVIQGIRQNLVGGPNMIEQFTLDLKCNKGNGGIIRPPIDLR
ncbi:hypothetical protein [Pseudoalteromonas luteoviolacea]|uniref:Uncharacterized protein n=1 Tax=Pseudoalteromonas luteoviolacea DSM 6061 TaxID=1365250 RepID=A0A166VZA5_9GAMM|nr:hypothetical protein [Pseudoalteromonas luteoviolacea]KZN34830.1 hypothetical protein N475_18940 [Pseudoalteromonas luteoviolacea DSM 6061]KZN60463.1 hypothetical protein N474_25200 [Pseudoalteromonas luteoviolacea CPMOR-2]MBE0385484.1 hypothetical protein [Pseudoalteromonas luteoviolacea DSM 6061]TQF70090.1 hypothetical protein FLM44_03075 [Pseudoalteromonas luteoviolacea]